MIKLLIILGREKYGLSRDCILIIFLITLIVAPSTPGDEPANIPPIEPLIWQWPQEVTWRPEFGPIWVSVGHTATALLFEPAGVRENEGAAIETWDGSGMIHRVRLTVLPIKGFNPQTNAPLISDEGEPLAMLDVSADYPEAGTRKRGLHRARAGHWDFNFGPLPAAPYTMRQHLYFRRSEQFKYCLIIHVEGDIQPLSEALAEKSGSRNCFKDIKIHILVAQLLEDPALEMTSTWRVGEPMPRGLQRSTSWYERERVKAEWMLTGPPVRAAVGKLESDQNGKVVLLPQDRTVQDLAGAIAAEEKKIEDDERQRLIMRDIENREIIPDLDDL